MTDPVQRERVEAPVDLLELVEEFNGWWLLNREGSVNAAYARIDKFTKAARSALEAVETAAALPSASPIPPSVERLDLERVQEIAALLRGIFNGFVNESLNGVVCSIPDSGLDTPTHRLWCKSCQRRWKEFNRLTRELIDLCSASGVVVPPSSQEP